MLGSANVKFIESIDSIQFIFCFGLPFRRWAGSRVSRFEQISRRHNYYDVGEEDAGGLPMDATRGRHEPDDRTANERLPMRHSSSGSQSSASSGDNDYGQRIWVNGRVKQRLCPKCQSTATQRSKRRGALELTLMGLLPVRPFRCRDCDWRFYGLLFNMRSV
jgi:hypothetical protein